MKPIVNRWQALLAGLYVCIASTFLGAVLLDVVYASAASGNPDSIEMAALFSRAADFFLFLGVATFFAGLGAIFAVWSLPSARNLFIISLVFAAAEFLIPVFLGSLLLKAQVSSGLHIGAWIRIVGHALSATLALVALWKFYPSTS